MASIVFHSPIDHSHPITNMVVIPKLLTEYFEVLKGKWNPKLVRTLSKNLKISDLVIHSLKSVHVEPRKSVNSVNYYFILQIINPFYVTVLFLYHPENIRRGFLMFPGSRKRPVAWNGFFVNICFSLTLPGLANLNKNLNRKNIFCLKFWGSRSGH